MDITLQRILDFVNERYETEKEFIAFFNLGSTIISDWKRGKSKSYLKMIPDFAKHFNATTDYLLGNTDDPAPPKQTKTEEVIKFEKKLEAPKSYPENLTPEEVVIFPVIGMIAAGYDGNVSFDPTGDEIPVPEYLLKTHNPNDYFVLQVIGNSMLPTYHNGDKVLIRKTASVDSGTIAAVGFDTENATLKKVEYVKGEDWMKLIPLNPDFPIKEIKGTDLELCHVYGEVVYKFDNRKHTTDGTVFSEKFDSLTDEQRQTIMLLMNSMLDKK